ncbi:hypothetical protein M0802_013468 [Mischocyttarus mexicanus]|nr:hypothetical protein M0802_013468 [Mischocyttarus mexicanus]
MGDGVEGGGGGGGIGGGRAFICFSGHGGGWLRHVLVVMDGLAKTTLAYTSLRVHTANEQKGHAVRAIVVHARVCCSFALAECKTHPIHCRAFTSRLVSGKKMITVLYFKFSRSASHKSEMLKQWADPEESLFGLTLRP